MMSRLDRVESRDAGWRGLIWAGATAALVTLVLAGAVALVWAVSRGPAAMPSSSAQQPRTPTPRILSFSQSEPEPATTAPDPTAPPVIETEPPQDEVSGLVVVSTPELLAMASGDQAASTESVLFEATNNEAFLDLASGSWVVADEALRNPGDHAVSERWLPLAAASGPAVAVEAEIRVTSKLEAVCDQSFGIAAGSASAALVFGGGVIFPCSGGEPTARVTDVSIWEDGYNADPVLDEIAFTPGDDWQTYRFEMRGDEIALLVDGERLISVAAGPALAPGTTDVETGLWSQGVGLEIRRVTVATLPT